MEVWEAHRVRAIPDEDRSRAGLYGLLAHLLAAPPDAAVLARLAGIRSDGSAIGEAFGALASAAARHTAAAVTEEYEALFIGVTGGELKPYASYYRTGFLNEKPLADLRRDLAAAGIARADGIVEPEDHIAFLCEVMHGLILSLYAAPAQLAQQRAFFDKHIDPWAPRFFGDLDASGGAAFYRPVGALGRIFLGIEREGFGYLD
jgi:TorA maturation chaperone TorD